MNDAAQIPEMTCVAQPEVFGAATHELRFEGRPVVRSPGELSLHPALLELNWSDAIDEISEESKREDHFASEPILITTKKTILAGVGRWRLALLQRSPEVRCIEYPISEEQELQFILAYHKPRRGWNAFIRIRLALTLEPTLQKRALDNMRAGGKHKGLANLPDPSRIDVRKQIADIAAAGARNVSNVKAILKAAHLRLIAGLCEGTLTINRAMRLCKLPRAEQLQQLILESEEAAIKKVIRSFVGKGGETALGPNVATVLKLLQQQDALQPGSVTVQPSPSQQTIILLSRDLFTDVQEDNTGP